MPLRRVFVWLVAAVVLAGAVSSASGSSSADQLIRPGVSVGRVRLGMTLAEVNRALGRPQLVNRRQRRGFGRVYVEYAWAEGFWRVGLLGAPGRLRVVRIATVSRGERTRERIGPGSGVRALWRAYGRRATCVSRWHGAPEAGAWIVLRGPSAMTAFHLEKADPLGYYERLRPPVVGEVLVQHGWLTPNAGTCTGWQNWRW